MFAGVCVVAWHVYDMFVHIAVGSLAARLASISAPTRQPVVRSFVPGSTDVEHFRRQPSTRQASGSDCQERRRRVFEELGGPTGGRAGRSG